MGQLLTRPIKTLFGGVSRQPQSVRRDNQVEEMDNALVSVVTGGFEKRPGSQFLDKLENLDQSLTYGVHGIDRDPTEQYMIALTTGALHVFDTIDGSEETVSVQDQDHYFIIDGSSASVATVLSSEQTAQDSTETAFSWTYVNTDGTATVAVEGSATGAFAGEETTLDTFTGTSDSGTTTITADDHKYIRVKVTGAGAGNGVFTLYATFKSLTYLLNADSDEFAVATVADTTFIVNRNVVTRMREASSETLTSTVQTFGDLPAHVNGQVHQITGALGDVKAGFFVKSDGTTYSEHRDPDGIHIFDQSRMPHLLQRQADGTFHFKQATWDERGVGDDAAVPVPPFIGEAIQDVYFHRSRLGFVSGEDAYWGKTNDTFNMWPDKANDVLDTDPVHRVSSSDRVTFLKWAIPFRKTLFVTAEAAQFEATASGAFTPDTAALDEATSYFALVGVHPITMGDVLYFPSETSRAAAVFEYFFEESSLSNTAADVTKHVVEYIPIDLLQLGADPSTGTMFALSTGEQNSLFCYKTFWDGEEKVMSSWSKWKFAASEAAGLIHGFVVQSGFLVLLIERADGFFMEQVPLETEAPDATLGYIPLLDQRTIVTGVYAAGPDTTTWTLEWAHGSTAVILTGPDFSEAGSELTGLSYPTTTTITKTGDHTDGEVYIGQNFEMDVELSKIFRRDQQGAAITAGRLQLYHMELNFQDTGYIKVEVTPKNRTLRTKEFTGRTLGETNPIGSVPVQENGSFRFPVKSDAETVEIHIKSDEPYPCVITGATWTGIHNERAEQG